MDAIKKMGIVTGSNSFELQSALENWLSKEQPADIIAMTGANESCPYGTGNPIVIIAYTTHETSEA